MHLLKGSVAPILAMTAIGLFGATGIAFGQAKPDWWYSDSAMGYSTGFSNPWSEIHHNPFGGGQWDSMAWLWMDQITDHQEVVGGIPQNITRFQYWEGTWPTPEYQVVHLWCQFDYYGSDSNISLEYIAYQNGPTVQSNFNRVIEDIGLGWRRFTDSFDHSPGWVGERIEFALRAPWTPSPTNPWDPLNGSWIDNFSFGAYLVPVPEPATIFGTGIGVVALLRRRAGRG